MRFTWDPGKKEANPRKHHGVTFEEAMEVFDDPQVFVEFDAEHSDDEPRFRAIGLSTRRLLVVVYTEVDSETIHIVSARKASRLATRIYEQE